jgi:hypothetical protein
MKITCDSFSEETCKRNFQKFSWILLCIDILTGGFFECFYVAYSLLLYLQYPTQNGIAVDKASYAVVISVAAGSTCFWASRIRIRIH